MHRLTYPARARRFVVATLTLALVACGGGGAVLPTEPGTGLPDDGGQPNQPPIDDGNAGGGGDGGGGGGGGGESPVTVTVIVGENGFSPSSLTIPVGSTVVWRVIDNHHDVTFVDEAPQGGDVPDTDEGESASRTFTTAGTYEYYCDRHDGEEMGTIVVTAGGGDGDGNGGGGDPQEPGASAAVRTQGDSFSPQTVTIAAGGSVAWTITGDTHNVTFTGATPPGGNIPNTEGQTVSRNFPNAGRYDYFCTRHSGMTGSVVVE